MALLFLSPPSLPFSRARCNSISHSISPSLSLPRPLGPFPSICPVALGTWSWGNRVLYSYSPSRDPTLLSTLSTALSLGVNFIDTADSYGTVEYNGRAERLLGLFLPDLPPVNDLIIATKLAPYPWRLTRGSIVAAAEQSAERLQRVPDILQLHWSTSKYLPWQETVLWNGVADAIEKGYGKYVGVSNYGPNQLRKADMYFREERGIKIATAQVQVNLLKQTHIFSGIKEVGDELGIGVLGYSPLALGVLAGRKGVKGVRGFLFDKILKGGGAVMNVLEEISESRGVSKAVIGMAWCVNKGFVTICGARTSQHVQDMMKAGGIQLSESEMQQLENASGDITMVDNIFETM